MAPVATAVEEERKIDETALITGSEAIAVACKLADHLAFHGVETEALGFHWPGNHVVLSRRNGREAWALFSG